MDETEDERRGFWRDLDSASVMTAELLTAVFVWGGAGWLVDTYVLGSEPWGMVTGFVLGFAAGTYLLYLRLERGARLEDERRAARR
jgi:F0F1-type ATP synthase assembly protein I